MEINRILQWDIIHRRSAELRSKERNRLFIDIDGTAAVFTPVDTLETLYEKEYFLNLKPIPNVVKAIRLLQEGSCLKMIPDKAKELADTIENNMNTTERTKGYDSMLQVESDIEMITMGWE